MDKLDNFFNKKYDYYLLSTLIFFSFTLSIIDYFSGNLIAYTPCFIFEQIRFIEFASFDINDLFPNLSSFFDVFIPGFGVLLNIIFENIVGSLIILGLYFLGKKLYITTKKIWIKFILKILFFVYLILIINAAIIMPIVGCMIQIG